MPIRLYFILIIALVSVSSTSLVVRSLPSIPALTMAFWRMLIASSMLWGYSYFKKTKPLYKKDINQVAIAGFFLGLHFACFFWGVRNTSIANATLLGNTGPLFTVGLTFLLYRTISKKVFYSLLISLLGILLIQRSEIDSSSSSIMGNIVSLLSGFCIAVVYMVAKNIRKKNDTIAYGRSLFFFAAVTIAFVCLFAKVSLLSFEIEDLGWFLFLGFVPSILGHNSLNYALKFLSPTAIASIPLGEPIIASLMGWVLLGEKIPADYFVGAPFVLIGICFILNYSKKNKTKSSF